MLNFRTKLYYIKIMRTFHITLFFSIQYLSIVSDTHSRTKNKFL